MEEKLYRQSRLCRLFGNPVVYSIVAVLHDQKQMTPTQIVEAVGRSLGRVSALLGALRLADVVRYETAGGHTHYQLKHRAETGRLLKALGDFVEAAGPAR
jgi:DNA-binding transcriptional regulator GbsR (MarR family)